MAHIELPAYGWTPRQSQLKAWDALAGRNRKRSVVLAAHRRWGKDEIAGSALSVRAMERVGNYWHCLVKQEQARRAIWDGINPKTGRRRWQDWFPPEIIEHEDNQSMKLTFKNKSTYQLFGSDNADSMVGSAPVGIVYSEAALANPTAFGLFRPIITENNGFEWYISSVRGRNTFYQIFMSALSSPDGYAQLLSAEDTEVFTPAQLEAERLYYLRTYGSAFGAALFEQEYLSSWDAAVIGAVFGDEIKTLRAEGRCAPFAYDPRYPVYTSWDIGVGDPTYVLFWQVIGNRPRLIDWYAGTDTGVDHYAEQLAKKPYYYAKHIGPHDIINRGGGNASSWFEQGRKLGINFERVPKTAKHQSISAGSTVIRQMEINVIPDKAMDDERDDCTHLIEAFSQYRFNFDQERKIMSKEPVHDWTSHPCDALMTFALWLSERNMVGRPSPIQGAQGQLLTEPTSALRLRDIMAKKQRTNRGAWG
jgi:phage terminase large subunit